MKTIEIKIYKFSELSEGAKEKAINNLRDINVDYDWWDCTYDDAKEAGLKINSFDLDRNRHATGEFIETGFECASKIIKNHGEMCETYKTAKEFLNDYEEMFEKYEDPQKPGYVAEEYESDFDNDLDELEKEFLKSILENYSILLQQESEYLMSDESIIETIEINDYDFTADGKLY